MRHLSSRIEIDECAKLAHLIYEKIENRQKIAKKLIEDIGMDLAFYLAKIEWRIARQFSENMLHC